MQMAHSSAPFPPPPPSRRTRFRERTRAQKCQTDHGFSCDTTADRSAVRGTREGQPSPPRTGLFVGGLRVASCGTMACKGEEPRPGGTRRVKGSGRRESGRREGGRDAEDRPGTVVVPDCLLFPINTDLVARFTTENVSSLASTEPRLNY